MSDKDLTQVFPPQPETPGMLRFEPEEYMEYLEDLVLTEAEKVEFLQTLWNIMSAFVNYGWGVDSVIPMLALKASKDSEAELKEVYPTPNFNATAAAEEEES